MPATTLRQVRRLFVDAQDDGTIAARMTIENDNALWQRVKAAWRALHSREHTTIIETMSATEAATLGAVMMGHALHQDDVSRSWILSAMRGLITQAEKETERLDRGFHIEHGVS